MYYITIVSTLDDEEDEEGDAELSESDSLSKE